MSLDPELVRANQQTRRWKNTCLNIMDRYQELCEAAKIRGMAFFEKDMDDVHEAVIDRISLLAEGRDEVSVLPPVKPKKETK